MFVVASFALQFANVSPTFAATLTWTGEGDATSFSDAENWSTGQVPVDGDILTFTGTEELRYSLDNDLDIELAGVITNYATTTNQNGTSYFLNSPFVIADGGTVSRLNGSGNGSAYFYGGSYENQVQNAVMVSGVGDLTVTSGVFYNDNAYDVAGDLTLGSGASVRNPQAGGIITQEAGSYLSGTNVRASQVVMNGGSFTLNPTAATGSEISVPIRVQSSSAYFNFYAYYTCNGQCTTADTDVVISSDIVLNADMIVSPSAKTTVRFTGEITYNDNEIKPSPTAEGTVVVGGQPIIIPTTSREVTDSQPNTSLTVSQNETVTLNGSRGYVFVPSAGVLKGTGTADSLSVNGIVAPGLSPGSLTVLNDFYLTGTYQAEILNKDTYDKLVVGEEFTSTSYSAVELTTTSKLALVLYPGWAITQGDQFMIIDNRSETDVEGTFEGLAEGAQIAIDGITFSITYAGGDGNDVVLTALNTGVAPGAPNTGAAAFTMANPILLAVLGLVTATLIGFTALKRRQSTK
jgi:fibronectin-binding autotransporter adhesin